jgi:putative sterol carrier protein
VEPFELAVLSEGALAQLSLSPSLTQLACADTVHRSDAPLKERETMADTAKSILESEIPALLKTKPELAKEINAVIHFNITGDQGGTWTLDLTKDSDWVQSGAQGTPKMTIVVSDQDFIKIRRKQLNAQMAAMQGKLKFKPMDMGLAMKLGKLLS